MEQKAGYKLSAPSLSALLTEHPKQMKAQTMDGVMYRSRLHSSRSVAAYSLIDPGGNVGTEGARPPKAANDAPKKKSAADARGKGERRDDAAMLSGMWG